VSAEDAGRYRCIAQNTNGRVFEDKKINIKVAGTFFQGEQEGDSPVTIPVEVGRQQEIGCPIKTYPYPLKFSWGSLRKGRRSYYVKEDSRVHVTEKGTLFYSLITKDDVIKINKVGGISCIMYHEGEPIASRKNKLRIEKDNVTFVAPFLYAKVTGATYLLKGKVGHSLRCIGGGNPVPHITWFKDGEEITSNDSRFMINSRTPGKLTINVFGERLAGNYKCALENKVNKVESSGNVYLATKPTLVARLPPTTTALIGRRLQLTCRATGTAILRYEWYRNGKPITSFKTHTAKMEVQDGKLLIVPVTNQTKGTYQCYAINAYGNTYSSTRVIATEPSVASSGRVATDLPVTQKTTESPSVDKGTRSKTFGESLQTKYIIIIACSGAVFIVLVCGGILMYYNQTRQVKLEMVDVRPALLQDLTNLPPPPPSLTDHSDDDCSSFGGYKHNHPLYYNENTISYLMNYKNEEHLYADIPEDYTRCESATPSHEL